MTLTLEQHVALGGHPGWWDHCYCAFKPCRVTACKKCGAPIPEGGKRRIQHDLCLACKGARIPPRCPYKAGDRVQMHGYAGRGRLHPTDLRVTGFRGVVEGTMGATILVGIADTGREWSEHWGWLSPDGTLPGDRFIPCTCCLPPPVQGDLFGAWGMAGAS